MSLSALQDYGGEDDDDEYEEGEEQGGEKFDPNFRPSSSKAIVNLAPEIVGKHDSQDIRTVDLKTTKELMFNAKYEDLFSTPVGPSNPFKSDNQRAQKNVLTGFVEAAHVNDFNFETERRTFDSFGYARDPSADNVAGSLIGNTDAAVGSQEVTVFEKTKIRPGDQRKRVRNFDATDMTGFTGPWGKFVDEEEVARPDSETLKEMEEFQRKRKKLSRVTQQENAEEKSVLHIKDPVDYQGRSFMEAPHDVGVNLRSEVPPEKCYVPKKQIHTWSGHTKGVQCIRWFPKTAHMMLSASMDCKIKLWEVYSGRRCIRSYLGHRMAVRDVTFNNGGNEFLSASYDRYVKLWDTETGEVKQRFHTGKVPYCVRFNPDEDKQHLFLAGMQDKKICQWDTRSGEIVQEYDRHLGAVNTITFFDQNRRFCSTSDDKSLRIWEWDIPVDTKLIQDPNLHSMPTITMAPNQKWLAAQAMDNKVMVFQVVEDKIRFSRKKSFKGHMVAGYACSVDFSPDMSYLISGDADGKLFVWDWKTHKIVAKWKAHDNVCIAALWHPHESSKIATCSWDGSIKFWD